MNNIMNEVGNIHVNLTIYDKMIRYMWLNACILRVGYSSESNTSHFSHF